MRSASFRRSWKISWPLTLACMNQLKHLQLWNVCPTQPCSERHSTCSIRTLSLSSLSLSKRSRSSFCLSISSLWRSRRRFSRSSRSRRSRSVISRRLEGDKRKVKPPAKTFRMPRFNPSHMYEHTSTLPADFCGSTDALHPLAHSLFFHLLKWQDVLAFVRKGTLLVHHLKLRQTGDTQVLKEATDKMIRY